ncbi:unnamed protein product [Cyclocybe aegerita]|uniref:Uncharacterized protein n=1 Tax=Cyclocybe aegerita TaxID=1973307 RepID=A0A8S0XI72_CYCAE|nr:unnamed protein product [Cyclocybe aegerita]
MSLPAPHLAFEEDIAQPFAHDHDPYEPIHDRKGKAKDQRLHGGHSSPRSPSTSSEHVDSAVYPPRADEAEETRRNLRRWEIAERQRRKAARESQSSGTPSLVSDVSRRASLLWPGKRPKRPSISGLGTHKALQSYDDLPLTAIDASPVPSPTRSESEGGHVQDPFNPSESFSPFSDSHEPHTPTIRNASSGEHSSKATTSETPTLDPSSTPSGSSSRPPPPMPINIPPPRTPPPILSPTATETTDPTRPNPNKKQPEVRWWHDWLCGCGEGPDRGGDLQAGRTNPFE